MMKLQSMQARFRDALVMEWFEPKTASGVVLALWPVSQPDAPHRRRRHRPTSYVPLICLAPYKTTFLGSKLGHDTGECSRYVQIGAVNNVVQHV